MNFPPYNPYYYQNFLPQQNQYQAPPMPQQMAVQSNQPTQQLGQGISSASRPVSNKDEANAVQADFSGAMMLFPDVTHNRIYLKRWNTATGAAEFAEFMPVTPEAVQVQNESVFITSEQVNELKGLLGEIKSEIEQLKKPATTGRMAKKNDASDE